MMPIIEQHVSLIAHMHTHITRLQDILPIALHRNIREREKMMSYIVIRPDAIVILNRD